MLNLVDIWPLFGLSLRSPRLELRPVRDEDLPGLIDAALAGIHDAAVMPFATPWTDAPREVLMRETAKHVWGRRSQLKPDTWTLHFAVIHEGVAIGFQDLAAEQLSTTRSVTTGSWLSMAYQGRGFGKEMRAAVLLFAFDWLGAEVAESGGAAWNEASLGVSRALGYASNGVYRHVSRPGELQEVVRVRLTAADFVRPAWQLSVTGFEDARRELLAID